MLQGKILSVDIRRTGSETASDHLAGAATLFLADASDFDDAGGQLEIDGLLYVYLTKDDDLNTVTLASGLTAPAPQDTDVFVYPPSSEKVALVDFEDGEDADEVNVPHYLADRLSDGVRSAQEQETVLVDDSDPNDMEIVNVIGMEPSIDGGYIRGGTVPPPEELPPVASPVPTVVGGIKILHVILPPSEGTNLKVEIHISTTAGFTAVKGDPATLVGIVQGSGLTIDSMPDDSALVPETTYYVSTIAFNDALPGGTPPSAPVAGTLRQIDSPDVNASAVWAGKMGADHLTAGDVNVTMNLTAGGAISAKGAGGQEVTLSGVDGLKVKGPTSLGRPIYVDFPVNGEPNIISGTLQATTLEVNGDPVTSKAMNLRGFSELAAGAEFRIASAVQAPIAPPTVVADVPSLIYTFPSGYSNSYGAQHGAYWDAANSRLYLIHFYLDTVFYLSEDGSMTKVKELTPTKTSSSPVVVGVTKIGTEWFVVRNNSLAVNGAVGVYVQKYDSSWNPVGSSVLVGGTEFDSTHANAVCSDGTDIVLLGKKSNGARVFRRYASAGTFSSPSSSVEIGVVSYGAAPGAIAVGTFDYGALRYVTISAEGDNPDGLAMTVHDATGTRQPNDEWPIASSDIGALVWDGDGFRTVGYYKTEVHFYSELMWTTESSKLWVSYSKRTAAGPYETVQSPKWTNTVLKRRTLTITVNTAGATSARVYAGRGASEPAVSAMWMLGEVSPGQAQSWGEKLPTIGTNPLSAGTYPSNNPGQIISTDGGSYWKGDNTVKFLRAILDSTQDVNALAGNTPALRIGNIAGNHVRYDNNQIQAMSSDSAIADLLIQTEQDAAGNIGAINLGKSSNKIKSIRFGFGNPSLDASGNGAINHGLPATPIFAAVGAYTTTSNFIWTVRSVSASQILVRAVLDTGAAAGAASRDCWWIAIC